MAHFLIVFNIDVMLCDRIMVLKQKWGISIGLRILAALCQLKFGGVFDLDNFMLSMSQK